MNEDLTKHECCWHSLNYSYATFPPLTPQVCCHCGANRTLRPDLPPPPPGHGPHYPRSYGGTLIGTGGWGTTTTGTTPLTPCGSGSISTGKFDTSMCPCRIENGGSGACHCILGGSTTFT